jgi:hypothetical protein
MAKDKAVWGDHESIRQVKTDAVEGNRSSLEENSARRWLRSRKQGDG